MEDRRDSMSAPYDDSPSASNNPFKPVAAHFSAEPRTRRAERTAGSFMPGSRYEVPTTNYMESDPLGYGKSVPAGFLYRTMNAPSAPPPTEFFPDSISSVMPNYDPGWHAATAMDRNGVPEYLRRDSGAHAAPAIPTPRHGKPPVFVQAQPEPYDPWSEMGWRSDQPYDQTLVMRPVRPDADWYDAQSAPAADPSLPELPSEVYASDPYAQPYRADPYAYPPESDYTAVYQPQAPQGYVGDWYAYPPEEREPYHAAASDADEGYPPYPEYAPAPPQPRPQHSSRADTPSARRDPPQLRPLKDPHERPREMRPWRMVLLLSCSLAIVFCVIELVKMVGSVWSNENDVKTMRSNYYQQNGSSLDANASRVELLPAGVTFVPTATPSPTVAPKVTPRINAKDPLVGVVDGGGSTETEVTAEPTATIAVRTKQTRYLNNTLLQVNETFNDLLAANPDVIGKITIDGLLDEVVMMRNNTYYLTHNARGSYSATGAVFVDESCTLRVPPENLLLRGKTTKEGALFSSLVRYGTDGADFVRQHKRIHLQTLYEEADYDIFAVIHAGSVYGAEDYFNYASHPAFSTDDEMMNYVDAAMRRSLYDFGIDVQPGDRLLTLATLGEGADTSCWIILARMSR